MSGSGVRRGRILEPLASLGWAVTMRAGAADDATRRHRRATVFLAAVAAGLALGLGGVLAGAGLLVAAHVRRRSRRAARSRQVLRELNDAAPLVQLAAAAGLTVRAALIASVPWLAGHVADELTRALRAAHDGSPLADELDAAAARLGEPARVLLGALAAADRYGAPLAGPLAVAGHELRLQRRRQLEQAARRIPIRMLFPLTLGVLPAFVLLAVVPLVATSLQGISLPAG